MTITFNYNFNYYKSTISFRNNIQHSVHRVFSKWFAFGFKSLGFFFSFCISQIFISKLFQNNHENISNSNKKKNLILSDPLYFLAVLFALYHAMTFTVSICISIKNGGESMKSCFWPLELYLLEPTIGHYFEESNHNDSSFL